MRLATRGWVGILQRGLQVYIYTRERGAGVLILKQRKAAVTPWAFFGHNILLYILARAI